MEDIKEKKIETDSSKEDVVVEENVDDSKIKSLRFDYFDTLFAYSRAAQTSEIGSTGSRIYLSSLAGGIAMYPGEQIKLSFDLEKTPSLFKYSYSLLINDFVLAKINFLLYPSLIYPKIK